MNQAGAQSELDTDLQFGPAGFARVTFRGQLNARTAVSGWNRLEPALRGAKLTKLEVDASRLRICDGAGLALLRYLGVGQMTPEAAVSVHGLETELEQLYRGFTLADYEALRPPARVKCRSLPDETGSAVRPAALDLRQQVEFLGSITGNLLPTLVQRKRMRWPGFLLTWRQTSNTGKSKVAAH